MKVYSIGREEGCNIVLQDRTNVISRRHAILNVSSSGKMTIVDQSQNGTYVNGIRISSNVPVPVTRKDTVSFAHVARLDWNMIPESNMVMKYAIAAIVAVIIIVGGVVGYNNIDFHGGNQPTPVVTDTTQVKKPKTEEELRKEIKAEDAKKDSTEKAKQDSISRAEKAKQEAIRREVERARRDSIAKARRDSIAKARRDSIDEVNARRYR